MKDTLITVERLGTFLTQLKTIFGKKSLADKHRTALNSYILEIDYDNTLKFDTSRVVLGTTDTALIGTALAGQAVVGRT